MTYVIKNINIGINKMAEYIVVEFNNIPDLFHTSRIFASRKDMKNTDQIVLLNNVCNFELRMNTYDELCYAVETLRYWNFAETPHCFYTMVLARKTQIRELILKNEYDLLLRFQTFRTFAEMCVLTITTRGEMEQTAKQLGLDNLLSYMSTNM